MTRKTIILLPIMFAFLTTGCEQKPLYPRKKPAESRAQPTDKKSEKNTATQSESKKEQPQPGKKSDVGVADAADYFTGVTPLKTKELSKKKLNNSYNERKDKLENALKEK